MIIIDDDDDQSLFLYVCNDEQANRFQKTSTKLKKYTEGIIKWKETLNGSLQKFIKKRLRRIIIIIMKKKRNEEQYRAGY